MTKKDDWKGEWIAKGCLTCRHHDLVNHNLCKKLNIVTDSLTVCSKFEFRTDIQRGLNRLKEKSKEGLKEGTG